jgi:hypothetical protein
MTTLTTKIHQTLSTNPRYGSNMLYNEATPINKLRAISAYCGNFVWDCLEEGEEQARWFTGMFTTGDATRVLIGLEKELDEQEDTDHQEEEWREYINHHYEEYLLGSTKCDGRE